MAGTWEDVYVLGLERRCEDLEGVLRYIASPTLGRPMDSDPAEFARDGADEHAVRVALAYCITLARQALDG